MLKRRGRRTGSENTWNQKWREQMRHSFGIPAFPATAEPGDRRKAAAHFKVSLLVVCGTIAQSILPARWFSADRLRASKKHGSSGAFRFLARGGGGGREV
jgi:hypothetical protein